MLSCHLRSPSLAAVQAQLETSGSASCPSATCATHTHQHNIAHITLHPLHQQHHITCHTCHPMPPTAHHTHWGLHTSGCASSCCSSCSTKSHHRINRHVMLQVTHQHDSTTSHNCLPMPPPASHTLKDCAPEVGLRLQDGRQKQPPMSSPHLHNIRQPAASPSPASGSDAQAAAPLLPQGSIEKCKKWREPLSTRLSHQLFLFRLAETEFEQLV